MYWGCVVQALVQSGVQSGVQGEPQSTISVRLVWPFIELMRRAGRDDAVARVPAVLGITEEQLRDPEMRIAQARIAEVLARWVERSGNRNLGLQAAHHVEPEHIGIVGYVAQLRPTLKEAFESSVRYTPLLGDLAHNSLTVEGELAYARLWFDPQLAMPPAAYEFVLALVLLRARRLTGMPGLSPREVHFVHPQPADDRLHAKVFGCPLRFDMPITQVVMPAHVLDMPLASAEPGLAKLLEHQADGMLERLPRSDKLGARVRTLLSGKTSLRSSSAEGTARALGVSERSLCRKLNAEGTSYRELLDEARMHTALRDLEQTSRSIGEIAYQLGFASTQAFHRAFRRWTGATASAHRTEARERRRV